MLRFILKMSYKDPSTGHEGGNSYTIDGDVKELEKCLRRGGFSENGYEKHELIGVELLDDVPEKQYIPPMEPIMPNPIFPMEQKNTCPTCGIELSEVMMYCCPRIDCPCGMGPVVCNTI